MCGWMFKPRWHCSRPEDDPLHTTVPEGSVLTNNLEATVATPYGSDADQFGHISLPRPVRLREVTPEAHEGIKSILRGDPPPPPSAPAVASDFFQGCVELARTKDKSYGGAWRRQGYMGNLSRILSKAARLENMAWSDNPDLGENGILAESEESLEDTLKDLANLASFMYANMREGNRWGAR